ncbi:MULTISPECIES: SRPBCC family protein [unclassified Methylosinus]|uniref:SRPBCC family protein n=1 Tax=unclassified Methylosinus TaxID=2624500 RepID=UPI000A58E80E|nr:MULTISPECIES: SRPBCC family protein [unclassified Methylosinus]
MFDDLLAGSEFLHGASGAVVWLFLAFSAWWIMFRARLGRRVFRHGVSIAAPVERVWSAFILEPSPPGAFPLVLEQTFLEGEPLRHKAVVGLGGRSGKTRTLISRVVGMRRCERFEIEYETIDGAAVGAADMVRARTRFAEAGGATQLEFEIDQPVRGVFGYLSTARLYRQALDHLRAHCEDREAPRAQPLVGKKGAAWLAVAAVAATTLVVGVNNPNIGWLCVLVAVCVELSILIHEYGHFLAMRWFGHSDASVVLIPFFGGATFGARAVSSRYEQAMIALAGPAISALVVLPLTPLAHWGLHAARSGSGDSTSLVGFSVVVFLGVSVSMNLFNLAPVGMLDGRKVADALARGRAARLLIKSAISAAIVFSLLACESESDLGVDLALIVAVWIYDLKTAEPLDLQLEPMTRGQSATTLAALVATFIVYAGAAQYFLPTATAALQSDADASTTE